MEIRYSAGLDLGPGQEFTALAVLERATPSYPQIVERVREVPQWGWIGNLTTPSKSRVLVRKTFRAVEPPIFSLRLPYAYPIPCR
jgi:hypothetical protein